ncbi:MAG TPA: hypothetical protein VL022_01070 [Moheibacter sp.]|nr:hypothetical protein [Moheibacter sp.]
MLIQDFYQIIDLTQVESDHSARIELNENHPIFDGHFPENPVMPGVCMFQIIQELTEKVVQKKLSLQQVSNVKFMVLINPKIDNQLTFHFSIVPENATYKVKSQLVFQEQIALKMNATYTNID